MNIEVRDLRNGDWYWINKLVLKNYAKDIGAVALAVYNVLCSYSNQNGISYPSQQTIGDILGYTRITVCRAIKTLEKFKLIRIERTRHHLIYYLNKINCSNDQLQNSRCILNETCITREHYRLKKTCQSQESLKDSRCIPNETCISDEHCIPNEIQMYTRRNSDVYQMNTINNIEQELYNNKYIYSPKEKEKDFENIWKEYPSKVGKKQALKHFINSIETKEDLKLIYQALDNYKRSKRVKNGFIQNGSTWFNNWRDWIISPESPNKLDNISDELKPFVDIENEKE